MLGVAEGQDAFAGVLADHELEAAIGGVDGDEQDGAIVVLPRCHGDYRGWILCQEATTTAPREE